MNPTIGYSNGFTKPKIAITTGDPAGIGPEICNKVAKQVSDLEAFCVPVFLGDSAAFELLSHSNETAELTQLSLADLADDPDFNSPSFVNFEIEKIDQISLGVASSCGGNASYKYLKQAIQWSLDGWIDAITTGPINKLALHKAGHHYPGHTEILAEETSTDDFCMMQYSEEVTCSFVTTHVGYAEVPQLLSIERILDVIQLSANAVRAIENKEPKIVVCGLNPHAGEAGLFGNKEEERIIVPAIQAALEKGLNIEGPFPPDTCFIPSRRANTDCFICMYHDQGHIPLKALVFDKAVNVTLGLPIVRTSVDHGTAYDIAGKNLANPTSMLHALRLAAKLAHQRQQA